MSSLDTRDSLLRYSAARWATRYRHIKRSDGSIGPYRFGGYEFLREPHDQLAPQVVFRKAAQIGVTEMLMTRAFHALDVWHLDVLYVLPTDENVSSLSAGRFAVATENSPRVSAIFSDVANVHHKRAGSANLYFHGSKSRAQLKSIPVALLILDEFDEMVAPNVTLARDRLKGQRRFWEVNASTPILPGSGVAAEFDRSDRRYWTFRCARCGDGTHIVFDDIETFERTFRVEAGVASTDCRRCGAAILEAEARAAFPSARWIAQQPERATVGYALSGLYSPTLAWARVWTDYLRAKEDPDPRVLREFVNGTLGLPFVERGYQVSTDVLRRLAREDGWHQGRQPRARLVGLGVDAGVRGHYVVVVSVGLDGKERAEVVRRVKRTDDVAVLAVEAQANAVVIDAQPNTEASRKLQRRLYDLGIPAWLCYYSDSMKGRLHAKDDPDGDTVVVNRSEFLSETVNRLATGEALFPVDAPAEAFDHVHALRRVVEPNRSGNLVERWANDAPDHFAHAFNYARIALELAHDESRPPTEHGGYADELAAELTV